MKLTGASPLEAAPETLGLPGVLLKREDTHAIGVFKWRGALPVLTAWRDAGMEAVVTASTGNHGVAASWAGRELDVHVTVFAPETIRSTKRDRIQELGADLVLTGVDMDEAKVAGKEHAKSNGLPFFEDGAVPLQYAGYGEIGREILEQCSTRVSAIVCPLGNGGLVGGVGHVIKDMDPSVRVIGVVAEAAPVMRDAWRTGRSTHDAKCDTLADGLAVRVAIPYAVARTREVVDEVLTVSESELAEAMRELWTAEIPVEGASAAGIAALRQIRVENGATVVVMTGRNIDAEEYARIQGARGRVEEP